MRECVRVEFMFSLPRNDYFVFGTANNRAATIFRIPALSSTTISIVGRALMSNSGRGTPKGAS